MLKTLIVTLILLNSTSVNAASKCDFEWEQLKKIQSLMRQKSTEYLRKIENNRHNEYQECRKGKNNTQQKSNNYKNSNTKKKYYSYGNVEKPFENSPVVIKTRFKGSKKEAWLEYYQKPKECLTPKTTSIFAKCLNDRDEKAKEFDISWNDNQEEFFKDK